MTGPVGRTEGQLVVLRGNSRAGKTSLSMVLRERPMAVVGQDHFRRIVLKEKDSTTDTDILGLLDLTVRYCLGSGRNVILEGILQREKYGPMIRRLLADHRGTNYVYYLDVAFDESVRRHAASTQACHWSAADLREWWRESDELGIPGEVVLDANTAQELHVTRIAADLDRGAAVAAGVR